MLFVSPFSLVPFLHLMRALLLVLLLSPFLPAHSSRHVAAEMKEGAEIFLATLSVEQRKSAQLPLDDQERESFHYFPMKRAGIRLDQLQPTQRNLAFGLLASGLSHRGFLTSTQIIALEQVLIENGADQDLRNPEKYYLAIFGSPADHQPWGWRFEGHHLSLNFTILQGKVTVRPFFMGTNPAEVREGALAGLRPLGKIEDAARSLARELAKAGLNPVFSQSPPRDIVTGQSRHAVAPELTGPHHKTFSPDLQADFHKLIQKIIALSRPGVLPKDLVSSQNNLHFAWAGSLEPSTPHYFRIQSESFLIEYANTQNGTNHAHLVWRDLKDDFGRDLLKEHFEESHPPREEKARSH